MKTATARTGDTLDAVLYRELGTSEPLAAALELNPHLRPRGVVLKQGDIVNLPELAEEQRNAINLWD